MKRLCEALASRTLAALTVTLALGILATPLAAAQPAACPPRTRFATMSMRAA
jgi:hypothetical protein